MIPSRKAALREALYNTFTGTLINIAASQWYFIALGIPFSLGQNLGLTVIMTGLAILRSYAVRRKYQHKGHQ